MFVDDRGTEFTVTLEPFVPPAPFVPMGVVVKSSTEKWLFRGGFSQSGSSMTMNQGGVKTHSVFSGDVTFTFTSPSGCSDYVNAGVMAETDDHVFDRADSNIGMTSGSTWDFSYEPVGFLQSPCSD